MSLKKSPYPAECDKLSLSRSPETALSLSLTRRGFLANATRILAIAVLIVGTGLALHVTQAQQTGIGRIDVLRHDLGVPGREVIQVRVDFAPGVAFPRHSHPGAEVAYVLEGTLEYRLDGEPTVTLNAGEALFIPAGAIHTAKNVGSGNAAELATYLVEKGKPLLDIAK
jgi:quercetin dioxygenase-like cupin family protein